MTLECCRRQRHLWQWRRQCVLHQQVCYASRAPRVTCHTSHVVFTRRKSHVTCNTSHVTRHTSHVTRHTSHVTRYTSHITHYTSRVTPHTPHAQHTNHLIVCLQHRQACVEVPNSRLAHLAPHTALYRITCHMSHFTIDFTLDASHVKHHVSHYTSPVTRHTSQATCLALQPYPSPQPPCMQPAPHASPLKTLPTLCCICRSQHP